MRIQLAKSKWERWDQSLALFLADAASAGFDATEIYVPAMSETPAECRRLHQEAGLSLIVQIVTEGSTPLDHIRCFKERFYLALECEPLVINCHTGRDYWPQHDNLQLFDIALELEAKYGTPICHETHRSRALFSAPSAHAFLNARPGLKLTADFSHWLCVHGSDLSDQQESVAKAVDSVYHIHARVGHSQAPQVSDPRAAEWLPWLELSLGFWRRIIEARTDDGTGCLTITPEFGPPPYMPTHPATGLPLADPWEVNCWMAKRIRDELGAVNSTPSPRE